MILEKKFYRVSSMPQYSGKHLHGIYDRQDPSNIFVVSVILMTMFVPWPHHVCFQLQAILSSNSQNLWIECFWFSGTACAA